MKRAVNHGAAPSTRWLAALFCLPLCASVALAQQSDFLLDEGQISPVEMQLDPTAERKAEAIASFITGIFEEESAGPEQALASRRRVLALDPGYTPLAIDVAYDYLRSGDSAEAIGVLKDAIKARPDNPEPALALSSIYLRHLRKPDLATRYAEAALKADPSRFAGYEALWEIAQAQGDEEGASRALDRALKTKKADTSFWLQLAEFFTNSAGGDPLTDQRAATRLSKCLERAAASAGENPEALARIADFHIFARNYEKAADFFRSALELKPNLPDANEKLAGTLIELGRIDEAIPVLERVVASNPLNLAAYDELWKLYSQSGDDEKALKNIEQALIIESANLARQQIYLELLIRVGRIDDAIAQAAEARRMFPQSPGLTHIAAKALHIAGRDDESLSLFERALVQFSSSRIERLTVYNLLDYAFAAEQAGRVTKAEELLRKALQLDPGNATAMNALGYFWVDRNENLEAAGELIRQALAKEPDNGAFIDSLGWYLFRKGDYQAAVDELLRAVNTLPEPDAVVFEHVGDAYHALGRSAQAVLYWQKAAAIDPDNKPLVAKIDDATGKVARKPDVAAE